MEGAGKSIAAEDVFPLAVVLEEGPIVLGAGDEAIHGERVQINAVGLGYGQAGAVVLRLVGRRIVGEGPAVVADDQSTILEKGHPVLVGMQVGTLTAGIPMTRAGPSLPSVGGGPEVDATSVQLVGISGVHSETEVIPGLTSGIGPVDGPAEQIRGAAVEHLDIPAASTVQTAPDTGESLVADLAGHGIDHGRIGGAKRHGNAAQAVGVAIEILGAPAATGVVAFGDEVAEGAGQQVLRVRRVDFEAGDVSRQGPCPAQPTVQASVHAETRGGPQGVRMVGMDEHPRLGPSHVGRPIEGSGTPAFASILRSPDTDGPGVPEIAVSCGDPEAIGVGGVERDVRDADRSQLAIAHRRPAVSSILGAPQSSGGGAGPPLFGHARPGHHPVQATAATEAGGANGSLVLPFGIVQGAGGRFRLGIQPGFLEGAKGAAIGRAQSIGVNPRRHEGEPALEGLHSLAPLDVAFLSPGLKSLTDGIDWNLRIAHEATPVHGILACHSRGAGKQNQDREGPDRGGKQCA